MKPKMKRKSLLSKTDIWNAVTTVLSEYDLSTEDKNLNEAFIVFQYYSELESGGHESLFTWFEWYIEEVGIDNYLNELIGILEEICAHDYAIIEKKYGQEMWRLYVALENDEIEEDEFYDVIEKANDEYHKLNQKLEELLETYFVTIHTDLIEVVED
ncbi:DMP19 family protein [Peribacillus sp. JNUCC 23]